MQEIEQEISRGVYDDTSQNIVTFHSHCCKNLKCNTYKYYNSSKARTQRKAQERESVSLHMCLNNEKRQKGIWPSSFHSCMYSSFVKSFQDHELFQESKFFRSFQPSAAMHLPLKAIYRIYWKPLHCKVWRYHRIYRMRGKRIWHILQVAAQHTGFCSVLWLYIHSAINIYFDLVYHFNGLLFLHLLFLRI
jgi:hypothetical protein